MSAAGPWTGPNSLVVEHHYPAGTGGLVGKEGYVGRISTGTVLAGSTAAIADSHGIITYGPAEGEPVSLHRARVRAFVGAGGWSEGDPLTVDTDGSLIVATPATDVTVAHADQDGIAGYQAWVYWPPDNLQIAATG